MVVAVVNFPPRQIGPFMSEVLTLGASDEEGRVIGGWEIVTYTKSGSGLTIERYATTKQFLDDLGLASLDQLPPIDGTMRNAASFEALSEQPSLLEDGPDGQTTLPLEGDEAIHRIMHL